MRLSYLFKQITVRTIMLIVVLIICFQYDALNKQLHISPYVTIAICGVLAWIVWRISKELDNRFMKGMEGEDLVYRELKKLRSNPSLIRDFSYGKKGDVDYIIVLSTCVWAIEVKSISGTITYREGVLYKNDYSFDRNPITQIKGEIKCVKDYINESLGIQLPVRGIIVFSNPKTKLKFGQFPIDGVYIVGIKWILKIIEENSKGKEIISSEECKLVENALKQYSCVV